MAEILDARRLLIFREVARQGSISAAARVLGWTQPAVSQHLRALERSIGSPVLLRGTTGVALTDAGRLLLPRADAVAAELYLAAEEMADLVALRRGRVRVAAYPSAAATLFPRTVAALRGSHPEIDVTLLEAEPPEALAALTAGEVDVALVFGYDEVEVPPGTAWHQLGDEPVLLVLPAERPVTDEPASLAAFAEEPWVVGCERCRAHAVQRCRDAGFEPQVRHVSDDYVVVQNLVAAGLGVTLLPRSALEAYRHPRLRAVPGFGRRRFGAVYREGAAEVPAIGAFLTGLRRAAGLSPTSSARAGLA